MGHLSQNKTPATKTAGSEGQGISGDFFPSRGLALTNAASQRSTWTVRATALLSGTTDSKRVRREGDGVERRFGLDPMPSDTLIARNGFLETLFNAALCILLGPRLADHLRFDHPSVQILAGVYNFDSLSRLDKPRNQQAAARLPDLFRARRRS